MTVSALVMTGTPLARFKVSVLLSEPNALTAPIVTAKVPLTSGTPEMTPLAGFRFRPLGNGPAVNEAGLLVAVMV